MKAFGPEVACYFIDSRTMMNKRLPGWAANLACDHFPFHHSDGVERLNEVLLNPLETENESPQ